MAYTGKPLTIGALVGGALGALCRPVVVFTFWFSGDTAKLGSIHADGTTITTPYGEEAEIIIGISFVLGFVISAVAVLITYGIARPLVGKMVASIVGGVLALLSAFLTFLPLACVTMNQPHLPTDNPYIALLYLTLVTLTGAVPGVVGRLVCYPPDERCKSAQGAEQPN